MTDQPQPHTLAEAEVIARHAGTLNWWAELVMTEYDRMRTEPVLAPNALNASAERWQLYAAKLEITLGELRGERDRLRAALKRSVADADLQWSGKSMPENELDEFADHIAHPKDAT